MNIDQVLRCADLQPDNSVWHILAAEVRRLREEINGLTGSLDRAESVLQNLMSFLSVNGCRTEIDPENAELRIRDGINMLVRPALERAEAAEAELLAVREDNHSMMLEIDELRKELAATAPNVPTDEQIHAAYRNALGQSIRERDMPEIRKFARALLQSATQPVAYGIDDEAARRIALAVHDHQNRVSDEPLLYAINRILIKEVHPLSAEGLAEVQSAQQPTTGDA